MTASQLFEQEALSRKNAAAASKALSMSEYIHNYPGMPKGAKAVLHHLKLDLVACCNFSWREANNKMLLLRSIALDCLRKTLPPIDEDQRLTLLHAPFKGPPLSLDLASLRKASLLGPLQLPRTPINVRRSSGTTPLKPPERTNVTFEGKVKVKSNKGVLLPQPAAVGGRLSEFVEGWKRTNDPYVLSIVAKGYILRFMSPPLLRETPWEIRSPQGREEILGMWEQISLMLQKNRGASDFARILLKRIPGLKGFRRVASSYRFKKFKCPHLGTSLSYVHYRLSSEYCAKRRLCIQDRPAGCILSRTDSSKKQKYLRFAFENKVYQFPVLPFGLNTVPQVFTRL